MFQNIIKTRNPFLIFLPFLILFIVVICLKFSIEDIGDEGRFIFYANRLLIGEYSMPKPNIYLVSGPGYPLILAPLIALGFSKFFMVLFNAVFLYLSIVFIFKSLIQFVSFKLSLIFTLIWGCYYASYQNLALISYEVISLFLISLFIFLTVSLYSKTTNRPKTYKIMSGLILGFLVLTKIIFGYVVLVMIAFIIIALIFSKKKKNFYNALWVLIISTLTFSPYLLYTYKLTNRILYFGTASDNLYWMTTPFEDEYGDWKGHLTLNPIEYNNYNIPGSEEILKAHHGKNYEEIDSLQGLIKDDAFKRIAIENIKANPVKFGKNILYNLSRLFFHHPFSYAIQKPKSILIFPINGMLLTFILLSIIPAIVNWKKIIFSIRFLLVLFLVYLGGSLVGGAEPRMLVPIVPILILLFAFLFNKIITINLKNW